MKNRKQSFLSKHFNLEESEKSVLERTLVSGTFAIITMAFIIIPFLLFVLLAFSIPTAGVTIIAFLGMVTHVGILTSCAYGLDSLPPKYHRYGHKTLSLPIALINHALKGFKNKLSHFSNILKTKLLSSNPSLIPAKSQSTLAIGADKQPVEQHIAKDTKHPQQLTIAKNNRPISLLMKIAHMKAALRKAFMNSFVNWFIRSKPAGVSGLIEGATGSSKTWSSTYAKQINALTNSREEQRAKPSAAESDTNTNPDHESPYSADTNGYMSEDVSYDESNPYTWEDYKPFWQTNIYSSPIYPSPTDPPSFPERPYSAINQYRR